MPLDQPLKKAKKRPVEPIADKGVRPRADAPLPVTRPPTITGLWESWLEAPEPILRIEIIRIFAPLATLGFMSSRLRHADEWLGTAGFQPPEIVGGDWRQPLYLEPVSSSTAWIIAAVMVLSGLCVAAGLRARASALVFALTLAYVALADRLAAFTVSKLSPAVMLALAASPCGSRLGIDAWLRRRKAPDAVLPRWSTAGGVRFFQLLLPVFYCGSAIAKAKGGWLKHPQVLFTHLHDSYQTAFSWWVANTFPSWLWTLLQAAVFAVEAGAPLWFAWRRTRPWALLVAVTMHAMIAAMFWPVRWFSLLMITLWCGAFLPEAWLDRALSRVTTRR